MKQFNSETEYGPACYDVQESLGQTAGGCCAFRQFSSALEQTAGQVLPAASSKNDILFNSKTLQVLKYGYCVVVKVATGGWRKYAFRML